MSSKSKPVVVVLFEASDDRPAVFIGRQGEKHSKAYHNIGTASETRLLAVFNSRLAKSPDDFCLTYYGFSYYPNLDRSKGK